ncbi:nitroreductase family protein [Sulfurimonas sp. HSL3-2]|uniref:nitroreductase family protein n=1 Tax=Hydrocurvibacter mobilis TaxID=3131936 RepID=UPI0031FA2BF9
MLDVYEQTSLTRKKVAASGGYIDWLTQPSTFKHYPEFLFNYPFGAAEALHILELCRCVTSREHIGAKPYYKLNTPSAGNLHPLELYAQIRGVKGIISGIYHIDASADKIVLIQEIEADGIETAVGLSHKFDGMILIQSCVPFRSEWKYGERAYRYCYLDAGHQLASIQAAATISDQDMTILSGFDADVLNKAMGFKDEEFSCAVIALGSETEKTVNPLVKPLLHVAPTDYCDTKGNLPDLMEKEGLFTSRLFPFITKKDVVLKRRSARKFEGTYMSEDDFEQIMQHLSEDADPLECYTVVLKKCSLEAGVYHKGKIIKAGSFTDELTALLVDQHFIKNAQIVTVITSKEFSSDSLMCAGAFAHKLYLETGDKEIGFTGIGAFYDEKMQKFLGTKDHIMYVCAAGK